MSVVIFCRLNLTIDSVQYNKTCIRHKRLIILKSFNILRKIWRRLSCSQLAFRMCMKLL